MDSIEGRKTWVSATVKDKPDGVVYAAGKALFVIPKKHPLDHPTDGTKEQERAQAAGRPFVAIHSITLEPHVLHMLMVHTAILLGRNLRPTDSNTRLVQVLC